LLLFWPPGLHVPDDDPAVLELIAGVYRGAVREELQGPAWATEAWREWASHIVASEARGVPQADIVVACTMVRDVARGWHPWALRGRWFGWGPPDEADREAVDAALTGGCVGVPDYAFVGNYRDAQLWRRMGYIAEYTEVDLYLGLGGAAVVGVIREE